MPQQPSIVPKSAPTTEIHVQAEVAFPILAVLGLGLGLGLESGLGSVADAWQLGLGLL